RLVDRDERPSGQHWAAFRVDLVLDMAAGGARLLQHPNRPRDVVDPAEAGVNVHDDLNVHRGGDLADVVGEFGEGDEAEVRSTDQRGFDGVSPKLRPGKSQGFDYARGQRVVAARQVDGAVSGEQFPKATGRGWRGS